MTRSRLSEVLSWPVLVPLLVLIAGILRTFVPANGLVVRFEASTRPTDEPLLVAIDEPQDTAILQRSLVLPVDEPFTVTWQGLLLVEREGPYRFVLESRGRSSLGLDGHVIADNSDADADVDAVEEATATLHLEPGLHPIEVRYADAGPDRRLGLMWALDDDRLAAIPVRVLFPTRTAHWARRIGYGFLVPLLVAIAVLAIPLAWATRHLATHLAEYPGERWTNLGVLAMLGLALAVAIPGVGWGVPHSVSWAPDELLVRDVAEGLRAGFSGGWHGAYPPFHYFVLALLMVPFEVAERAGVAAVLTGRTQATLTVLFRVVSALMAVATAYLVYRSAAEIHRDRVAGVFGGLLAASMPLFAYYAGLANLETPYVFWFTLALFFYVRFLRNPRGRDLTGFAVGATLAVCTKDQAYAYFVLPGLYAAWIRYRFHPRPSLGAYFTDRGLAAAIGGALAAFIVGQNLVFNYQGFLWHLDYLVDTSTYAPRYARNLSGYLLMAGEALVQVSWSMGWPSLVIGVAGFVLTLARHRRIGVGLVLFLLSYQLFFVGVIRYQFDRFFLGVCVILAITGGAVLSRVVQPRPMASFLRAACAAMVVVAALGGAFVPVSMMADSRYEVERWLAAHVPDDEVIAYVGRRTYLPRLRYGSVRVVERTTSLERRRPDVLVVNGGYICRARPGTRRRAFYDDLEQGTGSYRLVLRHRSDPWWPVRGPDSVFRAPCENSMTSLSRINPEIRVYRRVAPS